MQARVLGSSEVNMTPASRPAADVFALLRQGCRTAASMKKAETK